MLFKTVYQKKFVKFLVLLSLSIFFFSNFYIIDYSLPFFANNDEGAFAIGSLSFLTLITGIKFNLLDPIIAPLLNIIIILIITFINDFIIASHSLFEIKDKFYLNPEIITYYGRISSLFITTTAFAILFLIFKKLKINFLIYFPFFISLTFSMFASDLAIRSGKNSYYLLFFLLQFYFFLKYFLKLDKMGIKSYFIFGILASLAWGVNYWSAIVSIYGILILHYYKYKFTNLKFLFLFCVIFFFLGFLPYLLLLHNTESLLFFVLNPVSERTFSISSFFLSSLQDFILSFKIIFNSELILILFIPLTIFYFFRNFENKKLFIITFILLLEPIILISIAAEVNPQLRYFSGLICLMTILFCILINDISRYYGTNKLIIFFLIINSFILINKIIVKNELKELIKNRQTFYKFYESNNKINSETLYVIPRISVRMNMNNLLFYKDLHEKELIKNKKFQKNNYPAIKSKIQKLNNIEKKIILKNNIKKDLNIFNEDFFSINDIKKFFTTTKKHYKYIAIQKNESVDTKGYNFQIIRYVKDNFELIKTHKNNSNLIFNDSLQYVFEYIVRDGNLNNFSNRVFLGNNYSLYKIN